MITDTLNHIFIGSREDIHLVPSYRECHPGSRGFVLAQGQRVVPLTDFGWERGSEKEGTGRRGARTDKL